MARTLTVTMPCALQGVRRKQRKTKWHWCAVGVPVEIAEAAALENPAALSTSYERWARSGPRRKETVQSVSGGHQGGLWRPVPGPDYRPTSTFDDLAVPGQNGGQWRAWPFGKQRPVPIPYTEALIAMKEVRTDTSEWAKQRAQRTAADLLLVDGVLYRKDIEPVWMVSVREKIEIDFKRLFPGRIETGIPVPVLEFPRAEALAAEIAAITGKQVKKPWLTLETADPAYLSRTANDTFVSMLTMSFQSAKRAISRECRGHIPEHTAAAMEAFLKETSPGGSVLAAAGLLDGLKTYEMDIIGYSGQYGQHDGITEAEMYWKKTAELAISTNSVHDVVGGAGNRPELDFEDEDALFSIGT